MSSGLRLGLLAPVQFALLFLMSACAPMTPQSPAVAGGDLSRIGFLAYGPPGSAAVDEHLRRGMLDLGYVEDKTIQIEYRYANGQIDRARELALELVALPVKIIVAGSTPAVLAAQQASNTVPIVMAVSGDPVRAGFAVSLAAPGGNITGLSILDAPVAGKRLELLRQIAPNAARIGVLWNPQNPDKAREFEETDRIARELDLTVVSLEAGSPEALQAAFESGAHQDLDALSALVDPFMTQHRQAIVDFAYRLRIPSIYQTVEFTEAGGLLAYGPDRDAMAGRAASYVDKILKGAKPAELPIEQPRQFVLSVNLKTAEDLGIVIPEWMRANTTQIVR